MSRRNIALTCFLLALLVPLGIGVVNLVSTKPLPWIVPALGVPWDQLSPGIRSVIAGYMKFTAAGLIGAALAMSFILFVAYRRGEVWALWAIGTVGVITPLLAVYGLWTIQLASGVSQPWYNPLVSVALIVAGLLIAPRQSST